MISGIVFDHDGTLINSLPLVIEATNATLVGAGFDRIPADEVVAGMVFPTAPRMALAAGLSEDSPQGELLAVDFYERADAIAPDLTTVYPGVEEAIVSLHARGLRMGVISNNKGVLVRRICAHLELTQFLDLIVGEEDMPAPKPDPRGLLEMLRSMALELDEIIYVGDSATDLKTAKAAGCRAWGVSWGAYPRAELEAVGFDHVIDTARELLDIT